MAGKHDPVVLLSRLPASLTSSGRRTGSTTASEAAKNSSTVSWNANTDSVTSSDRKRRRVTFSADAKTGSTNSFRDGKTGSKNATPSTDRKHSKCRQASHQPCKSASAHSECKESLQQASVAILGKKSKSARFQAQKSNSVRSNRCLRHRLRSRSLYYRKHNKGNYAHRRNLPRVSVAAAGGKLRPRNQEMEHKNSAAVTSACRHENGTVTEVISDTGCTHQNNCRTSLRSSCPTTPQHGDVSIKEVRVSLVQIDPSCAINNPRSLCLHDSSNDSSPDRRQEEPLRAFNSTSFHKSSHDGIPNLGSKSGSPHFNSESTAPAAVALAGPPMPREDATANGHAGHCGVLTGSSDDAVLCPSNVLSVLSLTLDANTCGRRATRASRSYRAASCAAPVIQAQVVRDAPLPSSGPVNSHVPSRVMAATLTKVSHSSSCHKAAGINSSAVNDIHHDHDFPSAEISQDSSGLSKPVDDEICDCNFRPAMSNMSSTASSDPRAKITSIANNSSGSIGIASSASDAVSLCHPNLKAKLTINSCVTSSPSCQNTPPKLTQMAAHVGNGQLSNKENEFPTFDGFDQEDPEIHDTAQISLPRRSERQPVPRLPSTGAMTSTAASPATASDVTQEPDSTVNSRWQPNMSAHHTAEEALGRTSFGTPHGGCTNRTGHGCARDASPPRNAAAGGSNSERLPNPSSEVAPEEILRFESQVKKAQWKKGAQVRFKATQKLAVSSLKRSGSSRRNNFKGFWPKATRRSSRLGSSKALTSCNALRKPTLLSSNFRAREGISQQTETESTNLRSMNSLTSNEDVQQKLCTRVKREGHAASSPRGLKLDGPAASGACGAGTSEGSAGTATGGQQQRSVTGQGSGCQQENAGSNVHHNHEENAARNVHHNHKENAGSNVDHNHEENAEKNVPHNHKEYFGSNVHHNYKENAGRNVNHNHKENTGSNVHHNQYQHSDPLSSSYSSGAHTDENPSLCPAAVQRRASGVHTRPSCVVRGSDVAVCGCCTSSVCDALRISACTCALHTPNRVNPTHSNAANSRDSDTDSSYSNAANLSHSDAVDDSDDSNFFTGFGSRVPDSAARSATPRASKFGVGAKPNSPKSRALTPAAEELRCCRGCAKLTLTEQSSCASQPLGRPQLLHRCDLQSAYIVKNNKLVPVDVSDVAPIWEPILGLKQHKRDISDGFMRVLDDADLEGAAHDSCVSLSQLGCPAAAVQGGSDVQGPGAGKCRHTQEGDVRDYNCLQAHKGCVHREARCHEDWTRENNGDLDDCSPILNSNVQRLNVSEECRCAGHSVCCSQLETCDSSDFDSPVHVKNSKEVESVASLGGSRRMLLAPPGKFHCATEVENYNSKLTISSADHLLKRLGSNSPSAESVEVSVGRHGLAGPPESISNSKNVAESTSNSTNIAESTNNLTNIAESTNNLTNISAPDSIQTKINGDVPPVQAETEPDRLHALTAQSPTQTKVSGPPPGPAVRLAKRALRDARSKVTCDSSSRTGPGCDAAKNRAEVSDLDEVSTIFTIARKIERAVLSVPTSASPTLSCSVCKFQSLHALRLAQHLVSHITSTPQPPTRLTRKKDLPAFSLVTGDTTRSAAPLSEGPSPEDLCSGGEVRVTENAPCSLNGLRKSERAAGLTNAAQKSDVSRTARPQHRSIGDAAVPREPQSPDLRCAVGVLSPIARDTQGTHIETYTSVRTGDCPCRGPTLARCHPEGEGEELSKPHSPLGRGGELSKSISLILETPSKKSKHLAASSSSRVEQESRIGQTFSSGLTAKSQESNDHLIKARKESKNESLPAVKDDRMCSRPAGGSGGVPHHEVGAGETPHRVATTPSGHSASRPPRDELRCSLCPYTCTLQHRMTRHLSMHCKASSFTCAQCSFQTSSEKVFCNHLLRHRRALLHQHTNQVRKAPSSEETESNNSVSGVKRRSNVSVSSNDPSSRLFLNVPGKRQFGVTNTVVGDEDLNQRVPVAKQKILDSCSVECNTFTGWRSDDSTLGRTATPGKRKYPADCLDELAVKQHKVVSCNGSRSGGSITGRDYTKEGNEEKKRKRKLAIRSEHLSKKSKKNMALSEEQLNTCDV